MVSLTMFFKPLYRYPTEERERVVEYKFVVGKEDGNWCVLDSNLNFESYVEIQDFEETIISDKLLC